MLRPERYSSKIIKKDKLTWKVLYLKLEVTTPETISFVPGQFVSVEVAEDTYRAYSIASDSKQKGSIELLIEYGHEGAGSNFFNKINIGDDVNFIGPSGRFKLNKPYPSKIILIATGSGITPFIPMLYKLVDDGYDGEVRLLLGFRFIKDIFFINKLVEFKALLRNFDYSIFISQPEERLSQDLNKGRITSGIKTQVSVDADYYVCGNPKMASEIRSLLISSGVEKYNILTEEFTRS
jgi:ferredoxin-NADP reductase